MKFLAPLLLGDFKNFLIAPRSSRLLKNQKKSFSQVCYKLIVNYYISWMIEYVFSSFLNAL